MASGETVHLQRVAVSCALGVEHLPAENDRGGQTASCFRRWVSSVSESPPTHPAEPKGCLGTRGRCISCRGEGALGPQLGRANCRVGSQSLRERWVLAGVKGATDGNVWGCGLGWHHPCARKNTGARAPGVDLGPETPPSRSPAMNTPTTALLTRKPLVFHSGRHVYFALNGVCFKTKDSLGDDPSAERHALFPENISHLFLNRSPVGARLLKNCWGFHMFSSS